MSLSIIAGIVCVLLSAVIGGLLSFIIHNQTIVVIISFLVALSLALYLKFQFGLF